MKATTDAAPFLRRVRSRRLRTRFKLALALAAILAVAGGIWTVFFSSWLAADAVAVTGTTTLRHERVVRAAAVDEGVPLLRVDLEAVRRRVAAIPAVAHVRVDRDWPHTVVITVTERRPLAAVHHRSAWWVMDDEGVLFRRTRGPAPSLPVVEVAARSDAAALREVASVVAVLPDDIVETTRRVRAPTRDSISLALHNGRTVVWGNAAESDRKAAVLEVLLRSPASVYDVSVPELPTTRR